MKLAKRQKGIATLRLESMRRDNMGHGFKASKLQSQQGYVKMPPSLASLAEPIEDRYAAKRAREAEYTPTEARDNGVGYSGPIMADKGEREGSCNRTACQVPLVGLPRWSMPNYSTGGRLYYCQRCVDLFHESDRQFREPLRCSIVAEDL